MPLGIIVAGHNGSDKSTMLCGHLPEKRQIPLINADRRMVSILPDGDDLLNLPRVKQSARLDGGSRAGLTSASISGTGAKYEQ